MMVRRFIPPIAALLVAFAVAIPGWSSATADLAANRWALTLLAVVFAFKGVLFGWMRQLMTRMIDGHARALTIFGQALCDMFAAAVVFNVTLSVFFGCFAWATWRVSPLQQWQIIALRAALAGTGTFVLGTGFGVAWEIRRSRTGVAVHVPTNEDQTMYDGLDRREPGVPGRRASDAR